MKTVFDFLEVYGVLTGCAAAIIVLSAMVIGCVLRMRRLEARVDEMEKTLSKRMDEAAQDAKDDSKRQRRLMNESMANLSESMTRAILTMKDAEKKTR